MEAGQSPTRVRAVQPRPPGSILKGLAPRALLASPDASPRAADEHAKFASLAEVRASSARGLRMTEKLQGVTGCVQMPVKTSGALMLELQHCRALALRPHAEAAQAAQSSAAQPSQGQAETQPWRRCRA